MVVVLLLLLMLLLLLLLLLYGSLMLMVAEDIEAGEAGVDGTDGRGKAGGAWLRTPSIWKLLAIPFMLFIDATDAARERGPAGEGGAAEGGLILRVDATAGGVFLLL